MPAGPRDQTAAAADCELLRRHLRAEFGEEVERPSEIDYELAPERGGRRRDPERITANINSARDRARERLQARRAELEAMRPAQIFAETPDFLER